MIVWPLPFDHTEVKNLKSRGNLNRVFDIAILISVNIQVRYGFLNLDISLSSREISRLDNIRLSELKQMIFEEKAELFESLLKPLLRDSNIHKAIVLILL